MAEDEEDFEYMQEDEAVQLKFIRPEQGIYHFLVTIFVLLMFIKIFSKYFSEHKDELLTGLFPLLFLWQCVLDIFFLLLNCVFNLPRYFPASWWFYYSMNDTIYPVALEFVGTYLFISMSVNVCMMALERVTATFDILAPAHNAIERIPRVIVLAVKLIIPAIPVRTLVGLPAPFFAYADTMKLVNLFTMHHGKTQTEHIGPFVIVATVITLVCFSAVVVRIVVKCGSTKMTDDLRRTVMALSLLLPQIGSGTFAAMGQKAKDDGDLDRANFLVGNMINMQYFFVLTGPLVIFFSGRARRALFNSVKSSSVSALDP